MKVQGECFCYEMNGKSDVRCAVELARSEFEP